MGDLSVQFRPYSDRTLLSQLNARLLIEAFFKQKDALNIYFVDNERPFHEVSHAIRFNVLKKVFKTTICNFFRICAGGRDQ